MLKRRIIPVLLTNGKGEVVKPTSFGRPYRRLGNLMQHIQILSERNIDELVLIDIEASREKRTIDFRSLERFAEHLTCPLAVGGGITSSEDIRNALNSGADKVVVKRAIHNMGPSAKRFGKQCIVHAIDIGPTSKRYVAASPYCGEVLLTRMNREGSMIGYDLPLLEFYVRLEKVPIIINGGCGHPSHMADALSIGASAVAAGSMFLYRDIEPTTCAQYLHERGFPVRYEEMFTWQQYIT